MSTGNNTSNKKTAAVNPLELSRDTIRTAADTVRTEVVNPMQEELMRQIFGRKREARKFSGEIHPGEPLEMKEVYSGKVEENELLRRTIAMERRLRQEESVLVERRTNELRVQIQAIHHEVEKVAAITPQLAQEVQIAAFQAPGSPSTYELFFLSRIFEFVKSFRKKIQNASVWLATANHKARKKNVWGANYKKHGAKYLLSNEHYLQRSAG